MGYGKQAEWRPRHGPWGRADVRSEPRSKAVIDFDASRSLESPLRLVLVAELLARHALSLHDAVLTSGRHEQDVVACLVPLVTQGILAREHDVFAFVPDLPPTIDAALRDEVHAKRDRLERERFVRGHVLRGMIGVDPKMQLVFEAVRQVCRLDVPVLVTGETGSGKELVARAIHELGPRRGAAFEAVNCATLPTALFESHMFGHARGAFTGATQEHAGIFERCDGGTILLDEIGELELANQAKLLRVLQDRTFHRLGESVARKSSFRLVGSTHRDLRAMVQGGTFREDLYYRCNVFEIRVPSLRERLRDLPYIIDALLAASTEALGRAEPPAITDAAVAALGEHRWPGNVRELENVLLRAAIAAHDGSIGVEHLHLPPANVPDLTSRTGRESGVAETPAASTPFRPGRASDKTLADVERDHIALVLAELHGNVTIAAQHLGIARASLYRKMREYGIARPGAGGAV